LYIKERIRINLTWERGRLARIVTAGGTPALPDIAKWASYLRPVPKELVLSPEFHKILDLYLNYEA
jgi:hypothetical protein